MMNKWAGRNTNERHAVRKQSPLITYICQSLRGWTRHIWF